MVCVCETACMSVHVTCRFFCMQEKDHRTCTKASHNSFCGLIYIERPREERGRGGEISECLFNRKAKYKDLARRSKREKKKENKTSKCVCVWGGG